MEASRIGWQSCGAGNPSRAIAATTSEFEEAVDEPALSRKECESKRSRHCLSLGRLAAKAMTGDTRSFASGY